jgi:hypothetical protein
MRERRHKIANGAHARAKSGEESDACWMVNERPPAFCAGIQSNKYMTIPYTRKDDHAVAKMAGTPPWLIGGAARALAQILLGDLKRLVYGC